MSVIPARSALLRTVAFHEAWGYAPTVPELFLTLDVGSDRGISQADVQAALAELLHDGTLTNLQGRVAFSDKATALVSAIRSRDMFQPRKRRRARRVARYLAHFGSVRFVALANTTALGCARDEADLDFFVVVKSGTIWMTRLKGGGAFKLLGLVPKGDRLRDTVCLSYFAADDALDLSSHMLAEDDPYFRYWFLSLLPLYDDGVSDQLWQKNAGIRARHPFSRHWLVPPDLRISPPSYQLPATFLHFFEPLARAFQKMWFPPAIRGLMNRDTRVMVGDSVLKFHVNDNREEYRRKYQEICKTKGISP